MTPLPSSSEESDLEMVQIRFTVLDLDSHPVPMDTVAITLVHSPDSPIYMAKTDIEETAPSRVSWKQCRGKPACLRTLLFSRMRDLFAAAKARMLKMSSRLSGGKGCHGKHRPKPMHHGAAGPHHGPPSPPPFGPFAPGEKTPLWGAGPPPPGHHHPHHMHHGGLHHTVSRVLRFIVMPAALGILAGLAASALGMLIGQVVVFFWLRYRRSTTPKNSNAAAATPATMEQGTLSEKEGLMAAAAESTDNLPAQYFDHASEDKN